MNQAAAHLAIELPQAVENKWFLKAERGLKKEIISKECIASGKVTFLRGLERSSH